MNAEPELHLIVLWEKARTEEAAMRAEAEELLRKVDLYENKDDLATSLPYGKQRHLEIARALATHPSMKS